MLWANDTGAYLIGTAIGKHRLFERISPKKSWEGSIGGFIISMIAAFLFSIFYTKLNIYEWFIFAALISVSGTYGDLTESILKRKIGVKDSGNILPGHGGLLDRFDSSLFAAPVIYSYLIL